MESRLTGPAASQVLGNPSMVGGIAGSAQKSSSFYEELSNTEKSQEVLIDCLSSLATKLEPFRVRQPRPAAQPRDMEGSGSDVVRRLIEVRYKNSQLINEIREILEELTI